MSDIAANSRPDDSTESPPTAPSFSSTKATAAEAQRETSVLLSALEQSARQAAQNWGTILSANERLTTNIEGAYRISIKESMEYAAQLTEMARTNFLAASELVSALTAAKSPSEVVTAAAQHARKQLELVVEQNRKLWRIGQRVASAAAASVEPNSTKSVSKI